MVKVSGFMFCSGRGKTLDCEVGILMVLVESSRDLVVYVWYYPRFSKDTFQNKKQHT